MEIAKAQSSEVLRIPLGQFGHRGIHGKRAQRDIAARVFDFIQCSETCVLNHENTSTPSPDNKVSPDNKASITLRPVSLPAEITLHILEYLNQPYQLQCISFDIFPGIIFGNPRQWRNISAFQICRVTRAKAIKRYGKPQPNSLPFDASVDCLSFRSYWFRPDFQGVNPRIAHATDLANSFLKRLDEVLRSDVPEPRYCLFYGGVYEESVTITNPGKQLCSDFLDKVRCVEVEADGGWYYPFVVWEQEWVNFSEFLGRSSTIRKLKINVPQLDTCYPIDPDLDPDLTPDSIDRPFQGCSEVSILRAFLNNKDLIKSLEVFEIEKTQPKCSETLGYLLFVKDRSLRRILFGPELLSYWY
ncbi:hypothetical protein F5Y01DRAFT_326398 [Xylaria sp. FL0043]|nr:hypothetical protein F5Y01DRAFT_326398 [Xylaria sp. FL0043]